MYIIDVYEGSRHGKLPVDSRFDTVDKSLTVSKLYLDSYNTELRYHFYVELILL